MYGGRNGSFTLYEDEGVNYNYEKGKFSIIPFTYDESAKTLTIGVRQGSFDGMLQKRTFNIVLVDKLHPKSYNPDAKGVLVNYSGEKQEVKL